MKKKYTHIFFDLDNTLWDFRKNSYVALEETFKNFFRENDKIKFIEFFEVFSQFNHALWKEYRNQRIQKNELVWLRFQKTFDKLNIEGFDAREINKMYFEKMPYQELLVEGALDILGYLKNRRYRMSIISNGFREVQFKKLENTGILKYFDKVFLSEDLKTPKPAIEIFEYAIKSVNAKKSKSIMVGDDWETDITGAVNVGIDAVYFKSSDRISENEKIKSRFSDSVFIVSDLNQLKRYL